MGYGAPALFPERFAKKHFTQLGCHLEFRLELFARAVLIRMLASATTKRPVFRNLGDNKIQFI